MPIHPIILGSRGTNGVLKLSSYSWTKLLLDRNLQVEDHDDIRTIGNIGLLELPPQKDAITVAADYLASVYHFTMSVSTAKYKKDVLQAPIEFWFCVPATWPRHARDATAEAARKAGFNSRPGDQIFVILEPEAAATVFFDDLAKGVSSIDVKVSTLSSAHAYLVLTYT